jgi:hypothetical protein
MLDVSPQRVEGVPVPDLDERGREGLVELPRVPPEVGGRHQPPRRLQDPPALREDAFGAAKIVQPEVRDGEVEPGVGERHRGGIAAYQADVSHPPTPGP